MQRAAVEVRAADGAGLGLFALQPLPPLALLGAYRGALRPARAHVAELEAAAASAMRAKLCYCMSTPFGPSGDARETAVAAPAGVEAHCEADAVGPAAGEREWVLDPTAADGSLLAEYAACAALRVNEPGLDELPNAVLVFNGAARAVQVWSAAAVPAGAQLLMYYGGGYARDYLLSQRVHGLRNLALRVACACGGTAAAGAPHRCAASLLLDGHEIPIGEPSRCPRGDEACGGVARSCAGGCALCEALEGLGDDGMRRLVASLAYQVRQMVAAAAAGGGGVCPLV